MGDSVNVGIATNVLNAFIERFAQGFGNLQPAIGFLMHALLVIDVTLMFVALMYGKDELGGILSKLIGTTFWLYLLQDFDGHASTFVRSLVDAGHIAAGGSGGGDTAMRQLFNPSATLSQGFKVTEPLHEHVMTNSALFGDLEDWANVFIAQVLTMIAFWGVAATAVMALVEYYWVVAVSGILVPFVFLKHTRWIAMKPLSMLLSSGVKLMALAFIMTVIGPVLQDLHVSREMTTDQAWSLVIGAWLCCLLAWSVPRFAQGMMAGAGGMGGGEVLGGLVTTAGAIGGAVALGARAMTAAGQSLPTLGHAAGAIGGDLNRRTTLPQPPGPSSGGASPASPLPPGAMPRLLPTGAAGSPQVPSAAAPPPHLPPGAQPRLVPSARPMPQPSPAQPLSQRLPAGEG